MWNVARESKVESEKLKERVKVVHANLGISKRFAEVLKAEMLNC
jgi:hypothetical protein